MGAPDPIAKSVVLFDGVCNLCNSSVQFIIRRDTKQRFLFAALQSQFGQQQIARFQISHKAMESIVLVVGDRYYQKSDAILEISKKLGGLWAMGVVFKILPRFIRDGLYDFVASRRYKWFGRQDECMIPTPELRAKFLD